MQLQPCLCCVCEYNVTVRNHHIRGESIPQAGSVQEEAVCMLQATVRAYGTQTLAVLRLLGLWLAVQVLSSRVVGDVALHRRERLSSAFL